MSKNANNRSIFNENIGKYLNVNFQTKLLKLDKQVRNIYLFTICAYFIVKIFFSKNLKVMSYEYIKSLKLLRILKSFLFC